MKLEDLQPKKSVDTAAGDGGVGPSALLVWIFRLRYGLHLLIFAGAFGINWELPQGSATQRVWLALPGELSRRTGVNLHTAIVVITVVAVVLAAAGAALRTWGTAYLGAGVVYGSRLRGRTLCADGPYRLVRNPLYVGTMLHTLAICVLLSWAGAAFAIVSVVLLQLALIWGEEDFLRATLRDSYVAYQQRVPRFLPRLRGISPGNRSSARWLQAFVAEIYPWGVAMSFAVLGGSYNAALMMQGVLVSLGVSIVALGLMKRQ